MSITKENFATLPDGANVHSYTLKNNCGMSVKILDYGATVNEINVPDRNGNIEDVVCGFDNIASYKEDDSYQGAVIGRVANRIGSGTFMLSGDVYKLHKNNGNNHLHGGKSGFNDKLWKILSEDDSNEPTLKLFYLSKDGEEGYPGNLSVTVTYHLTSDNALSIRYEAITDRKTLVNLTNHSYFNLSGYASGQKIYDHILQIDADTYIKTNEELIPTGEIASVEETPFDFRLPKKIGRDINDTCEDLYIASGYDHCFNFIDGDVKIISKRATVKEEASGRIMELYTDQPCVQLYTGNFLGNEKYPFKGGVKQEKQMAFCLETQHMPDAVNHDNFTPIVLNVGDKYDYTTVFKFSVE